MYAAASKGFVPCASVRGLHPALRDQALVEAARALGNITRHEDARHVLLQLRAISTLYADQVEGATATLRHKSLAADAEQRGIAKKMQAKTFAAYPNVDRPQVAIRMLAGGP